MVNDEAVQLTSSYGDDNSRIRFVLKHYLLRLSIDPTLAKAVTHTQQMSVLRDKTLPLQAKYINLFTEYQRHTCVYL